MEEVKVIRWPEARPPDEPALRARLSGEGLASYTWSNAPDDIYAAHRHSYHKVIYVVSGSIKFGLPELGRSLDLRAGDRLELPAGVLHDARVGAQGVRCLEAHRGE